MLLENVPISVIAARLTTRLLGKQAPSQELGAELEEAREVGRQNHLGFTYARARRNTRVSITPRYLSPALRLIFYFP